MGTFGACISWFVVIFWIVALVHWMIGADIDGLTGIVGILVFFGMGFTSFNPPSDLIATINMVGIWGSLLALPIVKYFVARRHAKDHDIEGIRLAYEGFVLRPNNPAAAIRIARHLYALGIRGHAYAIAEKAVPDLPRQYFPDEHRMFSRWAMHPPKAHEFDPIQCVECGHPNHPGTIHCGACGARFLLHRAQGRVLSGVLGRRLLAAWLAMMMILVGIPFASNLPRQVAPLVIILLMVAGCATVLLAFRPEKGSTA